jgi:hypothetical protein
MAWPAFLVPLALYAATASPYVAYWDTAEMQTVPYILGIAHPTGFPLFVMAGWAFTHVFAVGTVAWRMGFFCALAMAGAARLAYSLALLLRVEPTTAFGSAMLFAAGEVAWSRGSRAEVHAFVIFFAALAIVSAVRWYRTADPRALVWLGVGVGLGLATHEVIGLLLGGIAILVLARYRDLRPRMLVLPAAIVAASLALYLYLPLRSAYVTAHHLDPTTTLGVPPGRPYWDYAHPSTPAGIKRELAGSDFNVGHGLAGIFSVAGYGRIGGRYADAARDEFGWLALGAALLGFALVVRDEPVLAAGLVLAVALPIPFVLSYTAESDVERYFLPSYWLIAVLAGVGASRGIAGYMRENSALVTSLATATVLIFAMHVGWTNKDLLQQRSDDGAEKYVDRVIAATPDGAVIVANWAYATPLAYAAYVQGRMGHRIVETAWVGDDQAYLKRWISERPVYAVFVGDPPYIKGLRFEAADGGYPPILRVEP